MACSQDHTSVFHLQAAEEAAVISALEAELDAGRTSALGVIGIEMIPSRTALVNDRCLLLEDLDLDLGEDEELVITGMCALGHRRGGGDLHLHHCVVDVDAEEAEGEVSEEEAEEEEEEVVVVMLIVLCPVLLRKIGIDIGFDLGTCCLATFCYIPRVLAEEFAYIRRFRCVSTTQMK